MNRPLSCPARTSLFALFLALISGPLAAQSFFEFPPASPFNKKIVEAPDSNWGYSFLVGGHLYGAHENAHSLFPATSFLGNFKRINSNPVEMMISLGDLLRTSHDPRVFDATQRALAGLDLALYNAPGNHDVNDRAAYEKAYGNQRNAFFAKEGEATTQFGFFIKDDYFLILDSELLLEKREEEVKKFLDKEKTRLETRNVQPRNLFVFSHRLLWSICHDNAYLAADGLANEPLLDKVDQGKTCELVDLIAQFSHSGELVWFSGDVGADWSVPLIRETNPAQKVSYFATGIGDQADDALLKVSVSLEGSVKVKVFPLTDHKWEAIETYNLDYWKSQPKPESAGGDAVGDKVGRMLGGKAFWIGLVAGLLIGVAGLSLLRRRSR